MAAKQLLEVDTLGMLGMLGTELVATPAKVISTRQISATARLPRSDLPVKLEDMANG